MPVSGVVRTARAARASRAGRTTGCRGRTSGRCRAARRSGRAAQAAARPTRSARRGSTASATREQHGGDLDGALRAAEPAVEAPQTENGELAVGLVGDRALVDRVQRVVARARECDERADGDERERRTSRGTHARAPVGALREPVRREQRRERERRELGQAGERGEGAARGGASLRRRSRRAARRARATATSVSLELLSSANSVNG